MQEFDYEELRRATQGFSSSHVIGKGSHGCVYKGVLECGQVVAIKRSSVGLQNLEDNSKLENEVGILSSLPKTQNVVSLLGTSRHNDSSTTNNSVNTKNEYINKGEVVLVMEFMPHGSLQDLLHANPLPPMLFSWSKRAQIALQIAKGLQFLHSMKPKLIHRDIKSANILFDKDWNAKLADFGLAVRLNDRVNSVSRPAGTIGYLDPCYITPCMLSTKSDVFSFGVVLLEIISGQKVIDASRNSTSIIGWALPLIKQRKFEYVFDQRVTMPIFMEGTIKQLLNIAACCVSCVVDDRPTIDKIVNQVENLYVRGARFYVWMKLLRGLIILKRGRKMASKKHVISHIMLRLQRESCC